ncbi:MAG TPA: hypothetical protein VGW38_22170 [Chloroflexota bacterium]|nr:hypothetical protein [Chloroflexota bacterium]
MGTRGALGDDQARGDLTRELAEWNRTLERRVEQQVEEIERMDRLRRFLSSPVADVIVSVGGEDLLESRVTAPR